MFYVLIADNKTARVFAADLQENLFEEIAVFRNAELGRHERDLSSDRPGRAVTGASGMRRVYAPDVPMRRLVAHRWLKMLGTSIYSLLKERPSEGLILVAAPRTLCVLRESLPNALRMKVRAEISRDLIKHPQRELVRRLKPTLQSVSIGSLGQQRVGASMRAAGQ